MPLSKYSDVIPQPSAQDIFDNDLIIVECTSHSGEKNKVKSLATGEFFSARKAMQMALVGELGDHIRAMELARNLGKVPERVVYFRPRRGLVQRLSSGLASSIVDEVYLHLKEGLLRGH